MSKLKVITISDEFFNKNIQQIIKMHSYRGFHWSTDIDLLDVSIEQTERLIALVKSGNHILLQKDGFLNESDKLDYKCYLTSLYKNDLRLKRANIINLYFSEN